MKEPEFTEFISRRDYLAAHAPEEPQEWFSPQLREKPPLTWPAKLSEFCEANKLDQWNITDEYRWIQCNCVKESLWPQADEINDLHTSENTALDEWITERRFEVLKQWPYAWADAVLSRRNGREE